MLKASGVILPAIKEVHNEGASTPEVLAKGGTGTPLANTEQLGDGTTPMGPGLAPKVNLPEHLRGLMKVWGKVAFSCAHRYHRYISAPEPSTSESRRSLLICHLRGDACSKGYV